MKLDGDACACEKPRTPAGNRVIIVGMLKL
jgi:hypothetical protein